MNKTGEARRVLIVEDDKEISSVVAVNLESSGLSTEQVHNGTEGLSQALSGGFDLFILDIMLPGMDGISLCRKIRETDRDTPVLMLTAKTDEIDLVLGLELGADDYMTKPFSMRELIARVNALIRRAGRSGSSQNPESEILRIGEILIDFTRHQVQLKEEALDLTVKEFELLSLFAANPGRAYSRADLLNIIWGYNFEGYEHTVNTHINRLRNKIEDDPSQVPAYCMGHRIPFCRKRGGRPMIFRSFYARISLLFLLLIFLLGAASLIIAFNASRHLFDEVEQLLNREYASSIAEELTPIMGEDFSEADIQDAIHYMMVLNPMVEIYLLDGQGHILSYFAGGHDRVIRKAIDTEPLERFHSSRGYEIILGDDPRTEKSRKPFSASPLTINGEPGWVYVILRGQSYDHSLAMAQSNYYVRTGLFTFAMAILATLVAGLFLFFLLTNRLRKLSMAVKAFTNGRYEHRINVSGRDEVALLGTAFNEMAVSIQEGIAKLKEADALRSRLIANISHDLRSPLTSIRGHLETLLLEENRISEGERREYIEISLRNVAGFQKLVEELLDLAKLEARQISPERIPFSFAELVQDVVLKMRSQSEQKNITMDYKPNPDLPLFSGDIGLIERALTNIIGNAVEHSPESGRVTMTLGKEENRFIISVSDGGRGIPEADLPHVFERFYRADKSRTRKHKGTGLGLAIAKEVTELHGGTIAAENGKEGGAVITITLPIV